MRICADRSGFFLVRRVTHRSREGAVKKMWAESVPYRRPFNIVDGITIVSESPTLTIGDEDAI
jgi:hypothetical protein